MKTFLKILKALFLGLGVSFFILLLTAGLMIREFSKSSTKKAELPEKITLSLSLAQPMVEMIPPIVRSIAGERAPPTVQEWIAALELAAKDQKVSGVYIRAVGGSMTLTQAEELRASVARVRAAGKPVIFFTDSFGEMDNGTAMTYFAAAADRIIVQPGGFVGFTGIAAQQPFLREFFDRNGILPEFEKRRAYKTAMDNLTETGMTPENREELTRLINQLSNNVMQAVAKDRKMDLVKLTDLRDASPLPAIGAEGLIDAIQYEDEIKLPAPQTPLMDYFAQLKAPAAVKTTPKIALVDASGAIMRGFGESAGALSEKMIGAEDFSQTLLELQENKDISAVIIRLNSPGGSAIASETIYRAIEKLKAAGKPVIVSMTDTAASGGYYMAAPATKILALPSTLTGSIGVIVGKVSVAGLSQQYGVNWEEVTAGRNAAMFGSARGFNEDERSAVARSADMVYDTFKSRVAASRKLAPDVVEELAQGKVWTGIEAKEKGLVDQLGGLIDAIDVTRSELGLAADTTVEIVSYPNENNPMLFLQLLLRQMMVTDHTSFISRLAAHLAAELKPETLQMPAVNLQY